MAGLYTGAIGLWGGLPGLISSTTLSTPPSLLANVGGIAATGANLALWFDENQAYKSSGGGIVTPDSILTYTAPSPKLVYGSDGVLRYAPHNLLLQSQTLNSGTWVKTNVSVVNTADVVAPDGTLTADKIENTINAPSAGAQIIQTLTTLGTGAYVYSVYAKIGSGAADSNRFVVRNNTTGVNAVSITIDWSTGAITHITGSGATATDVGNGWWRIVMPFSLTATVGDSIRFFVGVTGQVEGVGEFIYAWGAQLNLGSSALTYIPTTTAAVYSLPRNYNPTTGAALGVLIEEARTNLCLYSDDFTNAAWVKSNLTTAKTATGPDGVANSASTLTATAANATARQDITSASAARITSMFVKRRTGTGAVYLSQGATTGSELVVNGTFPTDTTGWTATAATLAVVSGELEVTNTGASAGFADSDAFATVVGTAYIVGYTARRGTSSSAGIEVRKTAGGAETFVTLTSASNVDGFLYFVASSTSTFIRVSSNQAVLGRTGYFDNISCKVASETTVTVTSSWTRVATASATVTNPPLIIRMATSGDAIDVALFQIENGAFITSPIATVASQVTRAADNITILTSAFPYSATAGTFAYEAANGGTALAFVYELSDGTANERILSNAKAASHLFVVDGGVTVADLDAGTFVTGVFAKSAQAFAANDFAACINGGTVATDGAGTMPTVNILRLGRQFDGQHNLNGHIKRLDYYAVRKTDAELQVLST
jgi:hypothetical protein